MQRTDSFAGTYVIIGASDERERTAVKEMLEKAGAENISFADNVLELVLKAVKYEKPLIITEKRDNVLDLADALRYVTEHARYATVAVIADSWADESMDDLMGSVDVFATRPVTERGIMPGIIVDVAKKKRMMELEQELDRSEASFVEKKSMSFAEHIIMDTLGLSRESAGEYISSLAEKHGYDKNDVARIMYDVLLAGEKN